MSHIWSVVVYDPICETPSLHHCTMLWCMIQYVKHLPFITVPCCGVWSNMWNTFPSSLYHVVVYDPICETLSLHHCTMLWCIIQYVKHLPFITVPCCGVWSNMWNTFPSSLYHVVVYEPICEKLSLHHCALLYCMSQYVKHLPFITVTCCGVWVTMWSTFMMSLYFVVFYESWCETYSLNHCIPLWCMIQYVKNISFMTVLCSGVWATMWSTFMMSLSHYMKHFHDVTVLCCIVWANMWNTFPSSLYHVVFV